MSQKKNKVGKISQTQVGAPKTHTDGVCGHEALGQQHYSSFTTLLCRVAGLETLQQAIMARHIKLKRSSLFQRCQELTFPVKTKVIGKIFNEMVSGKRRQFVRRVTNQTFRAVNRSISVLFGLGLLDIYYYLTIYFLQDNLL